MAEELEVGSNAQLALPVSSVLEEPLLKSIALKASIVKLTLFTNKKQDVMKVTILPQQLHLVPFVLPEVIVRKQELL